MADFLTHLAAQALGAIPTVQPLLAPQFAPPRASLAAEAPPANDAADAGYEPVADAPPIATPEPPAPIAAQAAPHRMRWDTPAPPAPIAARPARRQPRSDMPATPAPFSEAPPPSQPVVPGVVPGAPATAPDEKIRAEETPAPVEPVLADAREQAARPPAPPTGAPPQPGRQNTPSGRAPERPAGMRPTAPPRAPGDAAGDVTGLPDTPPDRAERPAEARRASLAGVTQQVAQPARAPSGAPPAPGAPNTFGERLGPPAPRERSGLPAQDERSQPDSTPLPARGPEQADTPSAPTERPMANPPRVQAGQRAPAALLPPDARPAPPAVTGSARPDAPKERPDAPRARLAGPAHTSVPNEPAREATSRPAADLGKGRPDEQAQRTIDGRSEAPLPRVKATAIDSLVRQQLAQPSEVAPLRRPERPATRDEASANGHPSGRSTPDRRRDPVRSPTANIRRGGEHDVNRVSGTARAGAGRADGQTENPDETEPPPVIRVSIGRVDVRGIVAAAPAQRPEEPARPAMSLSDYLKQREAGPR